MKNPTFSQTEIDELNKATEPDRECDCGGEPDCEICNSRADENEPDDDRFADADALASAGFGTDEDYGGGDRDWEGDGEEGF